MSDLKIEVGKRYVCRNGAIAFIRAHIEDQTFCFRGDIHFKDEISSGVQWTHHGSWMASMNSEFDLVSEFSQDGEKKDKLKLVPGEKYQIEYYGERPFIFIDDKRKYGYTGDFPLVMIDSNLDTLCVLDTHVFKKYVEKPNPYQLIKYVVYDKNSSPCPHFNGDRLINLDIVNVYDKFIDAQKRIESVIIGPSAIAKVTCSVEPEYQP